MRPKGSLLEWQWDYQERARDPQELRESGVCVCVCMCEREREREREMHVCVHVYMAYILIQTTFKQWVLNNDITISKCPP